MVGFIEKMSANLKVMRILAFQGLCAWEEGSKIEDILLYSWVEGKEKSKLTDEDFFFPTMLIRGVVEHIKELDLKIKTHLKNWDFSRLKAVDKANLRLGTYSLLYQKDVHPSIVISEAVRIAQEYGTDDSYKFVNGILDSIKNSL